jgi:hypothetical protein
MNSLKSPSIFTNTPFISFQIFKPKKRKLSNSQVIGDDAVEEFLEKQPGDLDSISLGLSEAAAGELQ